MPQRAHVSSLEALDLFRAKLILYINQARSALEEVAADVTRTRIWIESEQRSRWEAEFRKRSRTLDETQQALFSARLSSFRTEYSAEQLLYHRAKRALDEAEAKLRTIKKWAREYDNRVQPLLKQTEKLHSVLANDLVKASAFLSEAINTISTYLEVKPPPEPALAAPAPAPAADTAPESPAASGPSRTGQPPYLSKGGSETQNS